MTQVNLSPAQCKALAILSVVDHALLSRQNMAGAQCGSVNWTSASRLIDCGLAEVMMRNGLRVVVITSAGRKMVGDE